MMNNTTMIAQNKTRQHILDTGYELIASRGFSALGLSQLLKQAEISKGSFYHHFSSKEEFGVRLIEEYFLGYLCWMDTLLEGSQLSGKERLICYWHELRQTQSVQVIARPCLVVKLSGEISGLSEPMRLALQRGCDEILSRLTKCLADGREDGSLPESVEPEDLAKTLYYLWLGACLANALVQDDGPLEVAMRRTYLLLGISGETEKI